jgi:molybdopterin-guanine dinucleotide biosynthesis protein A/thiamine kinase-like enzyme
MDQLKHIIVQAGGLGSRLETLTLNKPKALVPIDNLPIIFHLFRRFPKANFSIIADYKADVLEKYLRVFADVNWRIVTPVNKGTASGIRESLADCGDDPLMIIWCDLILSEMFAVPQLNRNYIGISGDFECRWSYRQGVFEHAPSRQHGVAGLFIFKHQLMIEQVPQEGEFVRWLQTRHIDFQTLDLSGTREIGTMLAYQKNGNNKPRCRPFNRMEFLTDRVTKSPITSQGEKIAKDERAWYREIQKYDFSAIPKIYGYEPLEMERIAGDNIFVYNHFTPYQKREILEKIVNRIRQLHMLMPPVQADQGDCYDNYIGKTFDRLGKVKDLVPFAKDPFITINGRQHRNVFYVRDDLEKKIAACFPRQFHVIHGDITFSNLMLKTEGVEPILIDPRGYFGQTKIYGDADYDWAKLYYSIVGDYDQFNQKRFALHITDREVTLDIVSNGWSDMEEYFFRITGADPNKIKLLHALIWLSLTTYAWEDYDSICGAFYKGILELNRVL